MKKKICIIGNSSWSIYNFRKELIVSLSSEYSIYICTPDLDSSKALQALGCEIVHLNLNRVSLNPLRELLTILQLRSISRRNNFTYILSYNIKPNIYSCLACLFSKTKVVANVSGLGSIMIANSIGSKIVSFIYRTSLIFSHFIFFQNNSDRELFLKKSFLNPRKSKVIPGSGINTESFEQNNYHLLRDNREINFAFIGRLIKDKGIIEYITAAHYFKHNTNLFFNVCGTMDHNNPSSVHKDWLRANSSINIKFFGHVNNIKDVLCKADCVILPSYREGMSRSLLEAASCGIPIITSNVPGCQEIVEDGHNGFLIAPGNSKSLIQAISRFIGLSREEIYALGCNGAKKARLHFSIEKVINDYSKILKN